jgi:hypothetical protein
MSFLYLRALPLYSRPDSNGDPLAGLRGAEMKSSSTVSLQNLSHNWYVPLFALVRRDLDLVADVDR